MFTLNCKGKLVTLERPLVMAIVNATPDSFYESSRVKKVDNALRLVERLVREGADIVDIGGQSTRPGAETVAEEEELNRVLNIIEAVKKEFPGVIISIDTYYARVAHEAVMAGASMVNDVSGGTADEHMLEIVAPLGVPYVLMHMRGSPRTMHGLTDYNDLLKDILDYFIQRIGDCSRAGIRDIIIDPGFGFAKTIAQNFELLRSLRTYTMLDRPILAGLSRKGTIYKTLGITQDDALNGTTVLNTIALLNGASILRVHDVKEALEVIKLTQAYTGKS